MSFNSMIVRLKVVASLYTMKVRDKSFNSMIVRLKADFQSSTMRSFTRFQFYDSPIKRRNVSATELSISMFQFYDSPIKRGCCIIEAVVGK